MKQLEDYQREITTITREAEKKTAISGAVVAWLFILMGVAVTGTMTYSLARRGMESSRLWSSWVDVAALFPVGILEGAAVALTYGNHHWFKGMRQRSVAKTVGWAIWLVLALTTVVHFASHESTNPTVRSLLDFYAAYVLPVSIVAVPIVWKCIIDFSPESQIRLAALDNEARFKQEMLGIEAERQRMTLDAMRDAVNSPAVREARKGLAERAAIEHARLVAGFIEGDGQSEQPRRSGPVIRRSTDDGYVNGSSDYPQ